MIGTLLWLVVKLHSILEKIVHSSLNVLVYICVALTIGHTFGWIERYIWWCLEKEAHKALNGAIVTIGSFKIDWSEILQGKITLHASNVIVHTKEREAWQWESPLVVRVGRATVECNAPITIFHFVFFRKELPIEIYTLKAADIQVFVERRDQVFNVYLFDKALVLPPPPPRFEVPKSLDGTSSDSFSDNNSIDEIIDHPDTSNPSSPSQGAAKRKMTFVEVVREQQKKSRQEQASQANGAFNNDENDHQEKAKLLVNEMLTAVETLGRAAQNGSLQSTIKQQGLEFADKLRAKGVAKQQLNEGLQVMKHVGKVAAESLSQVAPKHILPERRPNPAAKQVYGRVGRISIEELRIFTKDSWIKMGEDDGGQASHKGNIPSTGAWNKPIYIASMVVRASELCPPMSLKDANDLPAIYQSLDKVIEVAWKRLLAEMAKSNTGRLFHAAMGEVLSFMKPTTNKTTTTTTTSNAMRVTTKTNTLTTTTTTTASTQKISTEVRV